MKYTDQQKEVLSLPVRHGLTYSMIAYAGSGKTFILEEKARKCLKTHPGLSILYLAFNKTVQMEASASFPHNTTALTTHSLAYKKYGKEFSHKLGNLRPYSILEHGNIPERELYSDKWGKIKCAIFTLNNWLHSGDPGISGKHVPVGRLHDIRDSRFNRDKAVGMAKKIWDEAIDPESRLPMPHDGYLKLYELSGPEIGYDVIFIDEAQDLNPVTLSILNQQQRPCKFYVGDPHQQIYEFRGSVNAFNKIANVTKTVRLSHSFRFGECIAEAASTMLGRYKDESVPVTGDGGPDAIAGSFITQPDSDKDRVATLFRTNAVLFHHAVTLANRGVTYEIIGGVDHASFSDLWDAFYLFVDSRNEIRNSFIKRQPSFNALANYAVEAEDVQMGMTCRLIAAYRGAFAHEFEKVKQHHKPDSNLVLSTAHKAKGLEYPSVNLANDFVMLSQEDQEKGTRYCDVIKPEESNLIYVAMTRAQNRLHIDRNLNSHLQIISSKEYDNE